MPIISQNTQPMPILSFTSGGRFQFGAFLLDSGQSTVFVNRTLNRCMTGEDLTKVANPGQKMIIIQGEEHTSSTMR